MEDFKGDVVTMKIRMSELAKDTVPQEYAITETPRTSPFSSCFKGGVLSTEAFKQALMQAEPTAETQLSHWVNEHNTPGFKAMAPTEPELLDIYRFTVAYHYDSPCRKAVAHERQRLRGVLKFTKSAGDSFVGSVRSRIHKALKELERIHIRCIYGRRGMHYSDAPPPYVDSLSVHELITRLYPVFKKEDTGARYRIKEPGAETKPIAEVQATVKDPLYTFVIAEVDTSDGELDAKIYVHAVSDTSMREAERRLAKSRKGKLHTFYRTRTSSHREPECIAEINASDYILR